MTFRFICACWNSVCGIRMILNQGMESILNIFTKFNKIIKFSQGKESKSVHNQSLSNMDQVMLLMLLKILPKRRQSYVGKIV
jgi:hypothetical protein